LQVGAHVGYGRAQIGGAAMSIHTDRVMIEVPGAERPMPAYLARPDGAGPYAAVMVYEEIFGVNAHIRDVVERVAKEGYVAIAPHIHYRAAPDLDSKYDDEGMKKGMALIPKLTTAGLEADIGATLAFLRARKDVRGDRIGCMGFCIGGHVAYLTAAATDVRATASFYGGGVATYTPGGGAPTVTRTGSIKGRILCLFGGKDGMIDEAQRATIKAALEQHHIRHEIVVYPGAAHAFFRDPDPNRYDAKSAADAWERTKRLFAEELGQS
jgi:carboxymethylenebutenolidase